MRRALEAFESGFRYLRAFVPADAGELQSDDALTTYREACFAAYRRRGTPGLVYEGVRGWLDLAKCAIRLQVGRWWGRRAGPHRRPSATHARRVTMIDDFRHAIHRLRARPSTAVLAVSMLAAGIGLASAMFTAVDALILRPAPFRDPATFVWVGFGTPTDWSRNLSLPVASALRTSGVFAAAYGVTQQSARFDGAPAGADTESGARISPGLFEDLGVHPILGRTFLATEGGPGADDRILISETVWQSRFGADPNIVGRRVSVSGTLVEIVGVLPSWVRFPFPRTMVWRPLDLDHPPTFAGGRTLTSVYEFARLPQTRSREAVAEAASAVVHATDPTTRNQRLVYGSLSHLDDYSADLVRLLAWGVGLVFLVLCANVMNLILMRLTARRAELALCAALGASRFRLLRQSFIEQGLLILGSALGGIGVAVGLVAIARAYLPASIVQATLHPLAVDRRSLVATAVLGALALIAAGIVPAWTATGSGVGSSLQVTSRQATAPRHARRLTTVLLIGEVAFAVALLVAAGLQLRSFVNLLEADQGFDISHLVTLRVTLPATVFTDAPSRFVYAQGIVDAVRTIPGIEGASLSDGVPPELRTLSFWPVQSDRPGAVPLHLVFNNYEILPNFFEVLGIRLVAGRAFRAGDLPTDAILSETMAAKLFPGGSAVDHTIQFDNTTYRVIGVVAEIRNPIVDPRLDSPEFYQPLLSPAPTGASPALEPRTVSLTVRCSRGCPSPTDLRATIARSAPRAVIGSPERLLDVFTASLSRPRIGAILALAFAVIALLAFGGGLFAVLSRAVLERQREFGIRTALGAAPADLAWLVRSDGALIAGTGLASGTLLAWLLSRTLAAAQYQVGVADPLVWAVVCATVGLSIVAASWRPARRAAQIDPVRLLRED